jgi:hypothetical protein
MCTKKSRHAVGLNCCDCDKEIFVLILPAAHVCHCMIIFINWQLEIRHFLSRPIHEVILLDLWCIQGALQGRPSQHELSLVFLVSNSVSLQRFDVVESFDVIIFDAFRRVRVSLS